MADRKTDDPKINALLAKQNESQSKQLKSDMAWFLGDARGRRVMAHWFKKFGLFHDVFDTNGMVMAKKAALQSAAQSLYLDILAHTGWEGFALVMKEDVAEQDRLKRDFEIEVEKIRKGE